MLKFLFREIYSSTISWNRSFDRVHIFIKISYLIIIILLAAIINDVIPMAFLLVYAIIISIITRDHEIAIHSYKAPILPLLMISLLTLLFTGNYFLSLLIGLRILAIASTILSFFASTDPIYLSYIFEKLHLPKWTIISTLLTWRLIPMSMKILDESYSIAKLKGDPLWRSLVSATATLYIKSGHLVEALYIYGTEIEKASLRPLVKKYNIQNTILYSIFNSILIIIVIALLIWS